MKWKFLVIAALPVLAGSKRKHKEQESSSTEYGFDSGEMASIMGGSAEANGPPVPFDFNGTLRKSFAVEVAMSKPFENNICSPVSALLPLGKLVMGTKRGTSRDELLTALGYVKTEVKKRLLTIIKTLKYLPGVTLSINSVIYVSRNKHLQEKFKNDTLTVFGATVQKLNFEKPTQAAAIINKMVFESTYGKIDKIVSPWDISSSASVIIVNAIYFAGRWELPFTYVTVADFHTPTGLRKVPMMTRYGDYYFYKSADLNSELIEIPYEGGRASFVIVLPSPQSSLESLLKLLKQEPELLNTALSEMAKYSVYLSMPKFRIESDLGLNELYEKIGVTNIFSHESGLTKIVKGETVHVSKAIQKAYIEVTEKGTEAAAASAMIMHLSAHMNRVTFKADRAFLYFIKAGGEQLFAGTFSKV